ncbi:site-specific integrase [Mesorhizobium sp. Root552]|uniref:site-specific integrase n=1 Tax=Mesorhizobium sp. Root552 TaxID=1736555 RepID=UPI000AA24941|nr:site-specific integrase [Mesorhizobium sp. Root552]
MTRHVNVALPFASWPDEDQQVWEACFDSTDIFDEAPCSHLSAATRQGRQAAYGLWLGYLSLIEPDCLELSAPERINRSRIEDYAAYLRENCRDTTISHQLGRLFYSIRAMYPDRDWRWLYHIARRIARQAKPIKHPMVLSSDLYALGLRLMDKAEVKAKRACRVTKSAAMMYRDGLLIATLVEAPMRRRAFSQLRLNEHLRRIGNRWVIMVPEDLTKTRRFQEYWLSERLTKATDVYLDRFRLAFPGAEDHDWLWTYVGRAMTDKMIRRRTIRWTHGALGFPVSPHRFRNAAANFILAADPENVRVAKDLLGHTSFAMTEKHYIDAAQSRLAGRALQNILSEMKEGDHAHL